MYLKSLEMSGFKSFAEAKIEFPRGITNVVGPNGTGKSNIVDAILWVLGEQSTKTLRSERMEDVIFNGTQSRKPLGMAEVSLVLAGVGNETITGIQGLPDPLKQYSEVMITRRLYRDGVSEYLINKVPCRLKDIRALLLETRAGIKGHTVIEQGRIDQILNASPQERRELIEETAGIVRYKKQKAEALRKLEATQHNLARVRDVVSEVRRQLNSLERQARQARAYRRHHDEARALEIRLLVRDARRLLQLEGEVAAELGTLEDRESADAAQESTLTSGIEETRLRMSAGQETLDRVRDQLAAVEQERSQALTAVEVERSRSAMFEQQRGQATGDRQQLEAEERRAEDALAEVRERMARMEDEAAEADRRRSAMESSAEDLRARRAGLSADEERARRDVLESAGRVPALDSQLARIQARLEELGKQAEQWQRDREEIAREIEQASELGRHAADARSEGERHAAELRAILAERGAEYQRLEQAEEAAGEDVTRLQGDLAAAESRLGALEGVIREEMGYGRVGEEESPSLRDCDGVREAVAEWLTVPPGLERAVDAALGERGRAWLVENPSRALKALELLNEKRLGRGSFVPLEPRTRSSTGARPRVDAGAGVLGWALDLLPAREGAEQPLRCLLDHVLLVESLTVALRVWDEGVGGAGDDLKIVTLAGEVLDASGVLTGGQLDGSGGLLQRRKEVRELAVQRDDLLGALREAKARRDELRRRLESLRAGVQACEEEIRGAEMRVLSAAKDAEGFGARVEELSRRLDQRRAEAERAEEERARLEVDAAAARREVEQAGQEKAVREAALADLTEALSVIEAQHLAGQHQLTEARLGAGAVQSKLEHDRLELSRLLSGQQERRVRLKSLDLHIAELVAAKERSRAGQERNETLVRDLTERADRVRADYVAAQDTQTELHQKVHRSEELLAEARKRLAASREARLAVEVRRAELKTRLQTVESTLSGTYQLALAAALSLEPHEREQRLESEEGRSEEDVTQALREELQALRGKLDRMGPINLAAIEEHDALEERHRFLTSQEEDLSNSIKSLKEIIQRINRTTQRMFLETFNELQEKFGEVFSRLFPGGRAELILVEPEMESAEEETRSSREPGVDIVAQPPGKRLKTITMLSGGEKSLTAMALLFASFLIRPTPFCILDEIDAPLDEENVGRFADVLCELANRAQFIVITHNKRTMSVADSLFGVTMEDPGVSQLISIRLADLQTV